MNARLTQHIVKWRFVAKWRYFLKQNIWRESKKMDDYEQNGTEPLLTYINNCTSLNYVSDV